MQANRHLAMGEVAGGALTFTWSLTHTLLHSAWDANMSKCWHAGFQGPTNYKCFPPGNSRACARQQCATCVGITTSSAYSSPSVCVPITAVIFGHIRRSRSVSGLHGYTRRA
eukprot:1186997-Prorocentrum_minimum.AAC.3